MPPPKRRIPRPPSRFPITQAQVDQQRREGVTVNEVKGGLQIGRFLFHLVDPPQTTPPEDPANA